MVKTLIGGPSLIVGGCSAVIIIGTYLKSSLICNYFAPDIISTILRYIVNYVVASERRELKNVAYPALGRCYNCRFSIIICMIQDFVL